MDSVDSHNPNPVAVNIINNKGIKNRKAFALGRYLKYIIKHTTTISEIKKSTSFDSIGVNGIISLGKYTFVNMPDVPIKLCPAPPREEEK